MFTEDLVGKLNTRGDSPADTIVIERAVKDALRAYFIPLAAEDEAITDAQVEELAGSLQTIAHWVFASIELVFSGRQPSPVDPGSDQILAAALVDLVPYASADQLRGMIRAGYGRLVRDTLSAPT